jgi:hypothetical protein
MRKRLPRSAAWGGGEKLCDINRDAIDTFYCPQKMRVGRRRLKQ